MFRDRVEHRLARSIGLDIDSGCCRWSVGGDRLSDRLCLIACVALVVREPGEARLLDGGRDDEQLVIALDVLS